MTKLEMEKAQVIEAIKRMRKLNINENAIREFENEGKLNLSEGRNLCGELIGILYCLNKKEQEMVREFEKEYGAKVYHVIKNRTTLGLLYSFLYVSKYTDEWEMNNEDLDNGYPVAYVKNATDDRCSEFGSIGIKSKFGGVVRTA